jgi:hypothetical protein
VSEERVQEGEQGSYMRSIREFNQTGMSSGIVMRKCERKDVPLDKEIKRRLLSNVRMIN